jgi:hypothetical protein
LARNEKDADEDKQRRPGRHDLGDVGGALKQGLRCGQLRNGYTGHASVEGFHVDRM